MDTTQSNPQTDNQQQIEQIKKIKKADSKGKMFIMILMVVLLVAGAAFAGWWYGNMQAQDQLAVKDAEIVKLQTEKQSLDQQLSEAKSASTDTAAETTGPTEEALDNMKVAINDKNYVALKDYVDGKITVILAGSECCGARTFTEAAEDMKYLNTATAPWDFDLSSETLEAYAAGGYADYFPEGALVGKSSDNFVLSISFSDSGMIDTVFITNSAATL